MASDLPKRISVERGIINEVNAAHALRYANQAAESTGGKLRHTDGKMSKKLMAINLPSSRYS